MTLLRCFAMGLLLAGAIGLAGCGGGASSGPGDTGNLEGYVFVPSGRSAGRALTISRQSVPPSGMEPLNGATVSLTPGSRFAITGNDNRGNGGYFLFSGLEPGQYTATVSAQGYYDTTFTASVLAGSTVEAGTNSGQTVLAPTSSPRRKWTFMVYMDGDNDLEQFGILNMNQMESVGSTSDVNIVVQFDRSPGFDATNGDWTTCRRFLVTKDSDTSKITSPVLQDLGEVDMAKPSVMQDFITWATTTFPADHYCLVLWNHGAGWRSRNLPAAASRGIIFDDTSNTFMTMADLNNGMTVSGVHFDLVAIDCSLMGMLEVCYEIRGHSDYIAASEESPPGPGYPYDTILTKLAANPNMSGQDLGRIIVADHIAHYPTDAVTQSLVDTTRLAAYCQKVNTFGNALIAALPSYGSQFNLARTQTQTYAFTYYRDLYDFASHAKAAIPDAGVSAAADAVMQGLAGTSTSGGPVIAEAHNLSTMANSHGLSIYLPNQSQFFSGYGDLAFSQDYPRWNDLVRAITTP